MGVSRRHATARHSLDLRPSAAKHYADTLAPARRQADSEFVRPQLLPGAERIVSVYLGQLDEVARVSDPVWAELLRREAMQAELRAASSGGVQGRGGDGEESEGKRWFDRELPQVKVDVLRCCGWKGEESAALAAEFKLLHEGAGAGDEGACQVLDSGKGAVPSSSKDILLGGPGFVLKASTPQAAAAAAAAEGRSLQPSAASSSSGVSTSTSARASSARMRVVPWRR